MMIDKEKYFDIAEHGFEDGDIISAGPAIGGRLFLNFSNGECVQLNESDAIAISRHYHLINELEVK